MLKSHAAKYLNVTVPILNNLIKSKVVKLDSEGKIIESQLLEVKQELEERRKISKPVWINRNEF